MGEGRRFSSVYIRLPRGREGRARAHIYASRAQSDIIVYALKCMCIPSFILIGFCVRELHAQLCPYCNVWCLLLFYKNYNVYNVVFILVSSGFICLHLNALPEGVYCCFTRTTLFIAISILVYALKCMCIPSFILIGFCVSELHAHLCPYCNVWPEAVYCCFTRAIMFTMLFS